MVASQALVVIIAWTITFHYIQQRVTDSVETLMLSSNIRYAKGLSEALNEVPPDVRRGWEDWDRLQKAVEATDLPATSFVIVLDSSGRLLAHPNLRTDPQLQNVSFADQPFVTMEDGIAHRFQDLDVTEPVAGRMKYLNGEFHFAAAQKISDEGDRLVVFQPMDGLTGAGKYVIGDMLVRATTIGLIVLIPTGVLSWLFIRRHSQALRIGNQKLEEEVDRRIGQFVRSREALILGLAKLADLRDNDTGDHLERIRAYSAMLAQAMRDDYDEIDDAWIDRLRLASAMHDIGKVGVPDEILLKPGKLTDEEYERVKEHPGVGADTLVSIREQFDGDPLVDMSIAVTLSHHERWDGKGYPLGIQGEDIPLAARIVSVADVYDALTAVRVYKPAVPHDEAVQIIRNAAGSQFDPAVVAAFNRVHEQMRERSIKPESDEAPLRSRAATVEI